MGILIDITGNKYGKLTVVKQAESRNKDTYWECVCECGRIKVVRKSHLTRGDTKSCRNKECRNYYTKHNYASHDNYNSEYGTWNAMKNRCLNENHATYKNHGARGIKICESWMDFECFLNDMGKKPHPSYTLERINNDLGYFPGNCEWADWKQQNRNKRINKNNTSGVRGVYLNKKTGSWYASIYVNSKSKSLGTYKTFEEAVKARKQAELKYWNKPS